MKVLYKAVNQMRGCSLMKQGGSCLTPTFNFLGFQMKSVRAIAVALGMFCAVTAFAQTSTPATKAVAATAAPVAAATAPAAKTATLPAAGGGNGKVWVNSASKVYHCEGSKHYGTTKTGEYMTEADAKAKGNHADHGKACSK
jgi:hypothetical protein